MSRRQEIKDELRSLIHAWPLTTNLRSRIAELQEELKKHPPQKQKEKPVDEHEDSEADEMIDRWNNQY